MAPRGRLRNPRFGLQGCGVNPPADQALSARAERRAMIALMAAFALLVQALVATPAMAMAMGGPAKAHGPLGEAVAICTDHGLQTITPDGGPPADEAGGSCGHCVCPATVALAPPAPTDAAPRIPHVETRAPKLPTALPPPARGPPRPYGQGPPAPNA